MGGMNKGKKADSGTHPSTACAVLGCAENAAIHAMGLVCL